MNDVKVYSKILFLCVANSARSQMAEAIARKILPSSVDVKSAGSRPGLVVHPNAIQSLADLETDITQAIPKHIDSLPNGFLNKDCLVIRLCAEEECPIVARGLEIRDWSLPDPAHPDSGDVKAAFAETRSALFDRISKLRSELVSL
ncbi:MAG: arsenate reductase ArsC [Bdellovibrionales bacterium]|nr:arsenate reductase ArsC [Bdellovibrionales bacterium]